MAAPAKPNGAAPGAAPQPGASQPAIPLSIVDAPIQRVWAVSAVAAIQAFKVWKFVDHVARHGAAGPSLASLPTFSSPIPSTALSAALHPLFLPAILLNLALVVILAKLRIPRLDFASAAWLVIFALLVGGDWTVLGGWRLAKDVLTLLPVIGSAVKAVASLWGDTFARQLSISEHRVRVRDLIRPEQRILGQHTIHILPHSTAWLLPSSGVAAQSCYCLSPGQKQVTIPVVFNNTEPSMLQYSVTPFDSIGTEAEAHLFNVTIPKGAIRSGAPSDDASLKSLLGREDELDLELRDSTDGRRGGVGEDGGALVRGAAGTSGSRGQQQGAGSGQPRRDQHIFHLPVSSIGRVRLERVLDRKQNDARISRAEILIVECPTAGFAPSPAHASTGSIISRGRKGQNAEGSPAVEHFCPGDEGTLDVIVRGLAPLELTYDFTRLASGARRHDEQKQRTLSHISSPHHSSPLLGDAGKASSAERLAMALASARSSAASAAGGKVSSDYSWANAQDVDLPLTLDLQQPGHYRYALQGLQDACGHMVNLGELQEAPVALSPKSRLSTAHLATRGDVIVHSRPHVAFQGCSPEQPIRMIRGGGQKRSLTIQASSRAEQDDSWSASVRYDPDLSIAGLPKRSAWTKNITLDARGLAQLDVEGPGTYTLESASGSFCSGVVGAPWTCPIVDVPPPTAEITFDAIQDECAGPVGVKARAVLSGSPPFRLGYQEERKGSPPRVEERFIRNTREEIEFRPNREGEVLYRFLSLSDANYREIKLDGPTFRQLLHPLASARFVAGSARPLGKQRPASERPATPTGQRTSASEKVVLYSCEGDVASVDIDLTGVGPFELTYAVRAEKGSVGGGGGEAPAKTVVRDIKSNRHRLDIKLPQALAQSGGALSVSLVSIKDAKGCERPLTTSDLNIEVRRTQPTAGFVVPGGKAHGEVHILEGSRARLPMRVAGEGPWKVTYVRDGAESKPVETTLRTAEQDLVVDQAGTYRLTSIRDMHCPGSIVEGKERFVVLSRPRPTAKFSSDAGVASSKGNALVRPSVCVGTPDSVELVLSGFFPVAVSYEVSRPSRGSANGAGSAPEGQTDGSRHQQVQRDTFTAAQNLTAFQLATSEPGRHVYELRTVGDSVYAAAPLSASSERRLEQLVHPLPSASLALAGQERGKSRGSSFCVGDALDSSSGSVPTATLRGTPPFSLDFEIRELPEGAGAIRSFRTLASFHVDDVRGSTFDFSGAASDFRFERMGRYAVAITRIVDANGCSSELEGAGDAAAAPSAVVEVAETASIAPVGTREDFCIGETIDFVLQGTPPWTVTYSFNGKTSSVQTRDPRFSRVTGGQPGELVIQSVAHQQNKCQSHVAGQVGMTKIIHDLPTVRVSSGTNFVEDLREGNQAEINFDLTGVPPFSFTYQRTEPVDRRTSPKVLETHTVAGILDKRFTIKAAQEGTWSVTWLQDRWCSVSLDARSGQTTPLGKAKLAIMEK